MDNNDSSRVNQRESQESLRSEEMAALFRPPIQRSAAAILDRALFSKTIPIAAARVADKKQISRCKTQLDKSKDLLHLERLTVVRDDPDPILASKGGKCLLLKPDVKPGDPATWSPILQRAVAAQDLGVIPFNLHLDYSYWTYLDIMKAILPEESQDEIPVGFSIVGHVAHLNLRAQYLPYKALIASVLLDKNPSVRTVINKTTSIDSSDEDSPSASVYRTFAYEVLAGPDDMNVEIREEDCIFRFDYSKVYWNSRLNTEHKRLVDMFLPGEVVVDVMAGVGPFAVPAGKKGVWVWANDLNPDSFRALREAVLSNKVEPFVRPFNLDGHAFIPYAAADLLHLHAKGNNTVAIPSKVKRSRREANKLSDPSAPPPPTILTIPRTISHFVMNLPASAIAFLPAFRGLYFGHETLFAPYTETQLPMVHVHCFSTKSEDNLREALDICKRISESLGAKVVPMGPGKEWGGEAEVDIHDVRDVAPLKRMFCASFRLPRSVAFARRREDVTTRDTVTGSVVELSL